MKDNYIQLKKDDILRLKIRDYNGNETGEMLEFNLEDIELPLKYQELVEKDKKNKEYLRNQFVIIDKKQDVKDKNSLLSRNEKEKLKVLNDFFNKEVEVYNIFLGENGVQKLLNGRKIGWNTLNEINEIIDKQINPYLDLTMETIAQKIKSKYGNKEKEEIEIVDLNETN